MISNIKIKNFRSIRESSVNLSKLNVIFGKNGAGKTNFISAIRLLKDLSQGGDLDTVIVNKIAPFTNEFFYFKDPAKVANFEFVIQAKDNVIYNFNYSIGLTRYAGSQRLAIQNECLTKNIGSKVVSIFRREKDSVFSGEENIPIPFKIEISKLMLSSYSDPDVSEITKIINNYTFIDTHLGNKEGLMVVQGNKPDLNSLDGVAVSLFIKNGGGFEKAVSSIQRIVPSFIAPIIISLDDNQEITNQKNKDQTEEVKRYFVTWREADAQTRLSHLSLSHGDRRVIHLFFSLFNADEYSFFVVEEIENGMHIGRLLRLLDEFRTQATNNKIQILFTTHSNDLFTGLTVPEVIFCKKEVESGTHLVHVKDTQEYESIKTDLQVDHTAADIIGSGLFQ